MKGLPVVPDNILEDSVSRSFQSAAFKLHGFKFLDLIIKDLTLLKKCLFIPGIAHTRILTVNVLPSLKYFGLEFLLLFLLSLRLNDSIRWTLFNHSRKQIQSLSFCYSILWYEAIFHCSHKIHTSLQVLSSIATELGAWPLMQNKHISPIIPSACEV